jgi:hypothetical protein
MKGGCGRLRQGINSAPQCIVLSPNLSTPAKPLHLLPIEDYSY